MNLHVKSGCLKKIEMQPSLRKFKASVAEVLMDTYVRREKVYALGGWKISNGGHS
jgi:hypothetical protein